MKRFQRGYGRRATGFFASCVAIVLLYGFTAAADEPSVTVTTVLDGLHNPCGVAVQPGTGHVFVSDSGAGRIVRVTESGHEVVIDGFPQDTYGEGSYEEGKRFDIGPLGLAFVDKSTLVVGGGGLPDANDLVRVYQVPAPGKRTSADAMKTALGPIAAGEESKTGEGDFYGVAAVEKIIYVTCNGDDEKGWVARANIAEKEPKLRPLIKTKTLSGRDAPVAITVSSEGFVVVGQMGELAKPKDSLLTFYHPATGDVYGRFETGLHDVAGLAYSRRRELLYAVDFAWGEHQNDGGLYRLDSAIVDGRSAVKAVKIQKLLRPTAIAFAANNACYVTVLGSAEPDSDTKPGKLLRITGNL